MKKKLLLITLSLLLIIVAFIIINPFETSLDNIDTIYVYDSNQTEIYFTSKPSEDFSSIITMVNGARRSEISNKDMDYHILDLRSQDKGLKYKVYADFTKAELYLVNMDNNKEYAVDWPLAKDYLSIDGLVVIYPDYQLEMLISVEDNEIAMTASGVNWNLLKADGNYFVNSYTMVESDEYLELKPDDEISLDFDLTPDLLSLEVFKGDTLLKTETINNNKIKPIILNGSLTYKVNATYEKNNENSYGTLIYSFQVNMKLPPEVILQESTAPPGGFFIINVKNVNEGEEITLQQDIAEKVNIQQHGDDRVIVIPLDYWAKAGSYPLAIYIDSQLIYEALLVIEERSFGVQHLIISDTVAANTRNEAASAEYAKYFTPSRYVSHPSQLWEGEFIKPVEGRLTTAYGLMRTVNNELTSYRHSGLDLAAPTGTPIKASNSGKIVLSMNLIMTGETIVIDHGLGFFTVYFHLDRRDVFEGDMVSKGEIIGTVGSTGFSTGPHLHWTTSYYSTNIDPDILLNWQGLE